MPRIVKKEIRPLEEAEISAFLEAIQGHKYETVYLVTLFTGLRQGEVLGLTWDCVDFDNGIVTINKQLQHGQTKGSSYYMISFKNDKARRIAPTPSVMAVLRNHRTAQNRMRLQAGQAWNNMDNLVFTNELGEHLAHITVYKNFKKIVTD